ncbi:MAG: ABC transporter ATP-binding protein [Acidobacteriota bacterium]
MSSGAPEAARPLLEAHGVHANYGESHILRGVDLVIARGEAVGLLGRNGMGKTTLIRTLMGHVRATAGTIAIRGVSVVALRPDRIARMGLSCVPEGRGIFPNLSVRENLVMAARAGTDGRRDWTLEKVLAAFPRLHERIEQGGQQLSGGEQQMLAIGRALMTNPDLLILDEATEGLAPFIVGEIWRIVGTVRTSGIATLIVDRNYRSVLAHTDRALVLEKGRVAWSGQSAAALADQALLVRYLGV